MSSLKTPPANIEAEQSLLSAILMDQDTLGDVMRQLKPEDFYDVRHQKIYETAVSMYQAGLSVDAVTLADNLKDRVSEVGGISYLAGLFNSFIPVDINSYVKIIKDCSDRRYLMKMAYELHASAMKGEGSPQDILMSAFDRIYNLNSGQRCGLRPAGECLASTLDLIEANYKRGGGVTGIPTGFSELDNTINGLNAGDFIVIAARASMGKTAFALNIAANVAQNHTAALFSLEMPKEQLFMRMLSMNSMIELHNIKRGQLDDNGFVRIASSSADLAQRGLFVDDSPAISVGEIKAQCRKLKAKHGLDLVVVDYIGLVESGKKQETRQIEISTISRELKCMAMELGVAVIAVAQLNRAPEARRGNRPQLGDLRESGAIEQDADIVLLLYRDEYYNPDSKEKGVARCIIAKNRNGEVGDKQLGWNGQYQKFVDIDKKDYIYQN